MLYLLYLFKTYFHRLIMLYRVVISDYLLHSLILDVCEKKNHCAKHSHGFGPCQLTCTQPFLYPRARTAHHAAVKP